MPLYRIERDMKELSDAEREGAGFRAALCVLQFRGLRWIRSYFDPESLHSTCIYEAASAEQIREHAEMAHLPCASITEVVEVLPDEYQ